MRRAVLRTMGRWHREAVAVAVVLGACLLAAASAHAAAFTPAVC
jgi:hypothetical protein